MCVSEATITLRVGFQEPSENNVSKTLQKESAHDCRYGPSVSEAQYQDIIKGDSGWLVSNLDAS
jgi:hypothetical protein